MGMVLVLTLPSRPEKRSLMLAFTSFVPDTYDKPRILRRRAGTPGSQRVVRRIAWDGEGKGKT